MQTRCVADRPSKPNAMPYANGQEGLLRYRRLRHFAVAVVLCQFFLQPELQAQELNARVTVIYSQVSTTVDRKVF